MFMSLSGKVSYFAGQRRRTRRAPITTAMTYVAYTVVCRRALKAEVLIGF
jgi:hypothetical protein